MQEMQEVRVRSLGWEDPLEQEMATYCSILAWRIPWIGEPGRLQSQGHKESDATEHTQGIGGACLYQEKDPEGEVLRFCVHTDLGSAGTYVPAGDGSGVADVGSIDSIQSLSKFQ